MIWETWIPKKYQVKNELVSLEVDVQDSAHYYFSHLQRKKNTIALQKTELLSDLNLPAYVLKKKLPLVLIINGRGVVCKKVILSTESHQEPERLLEEHLPALDLKDFYIQIYKQENNTAFICFCRKSLLDDVLTTLQTRNYDLAQVYIGSAAIIGLRPLWAQFNTIPLPHQQAELTNGYLDTLQAQETTAATVLSIGGMDLSPYHVLGLAAGLSYLMQQPLATNLNEGIDRLANTHLQANNFRLATAAIIIVALTIALTNVLFFSSYFDTNKRLETELAVYQGKYEQVNKLLNDYQENKDLIEEAGLLAKNRLSEYADQICKTLPDDVVLRDLCFNPQEEKELGEDSLLTFQNKTILIRGNCEKSFRVNEWLNVLKMQKFVKDLSLEKFAYNSPANTPNFELKLRVK